MKADLSSPIKYLKGVGEKRAEQYKKLGVNTLEDLLYHFPRYYIDLSKSYSITSAPHEEVVAVRATLVRKSSEQRVRKNLSIFKLKAVDETGVLELTLFNSGYLVAGLKLDHEYIFYGKIEGGFVSRKMSSPGIYDVDSTHEILPVYSQTAGITSVLIRKNILQILGNLPELDDPIPAQIIKKNDYDDIATALRNIHFPPSISAAQSARDRFVFEELLTLSCALQIIGKERTVDQIKPFKKVSLDRFWRSLPFSPTSAQLRCVEEAVEDLMGGKSMNRLIQGDVGSGKTLVAAALIFFAYKNRVQSAMMVPTEILAEQHFVTMQGFLSSFGLNIKLLTSSTKTAEKKSILSGLADGTIDLCIGTHSLISEHVVFGRLGLVVTDEQHRFGVEQRTALSQKSENSHVLVMSATPIPRTLSLIIYGDLSVSIIDELPPGRQQIDTLVIDSSKLKRAFGFIREHLDRGLQCYIVCPLITVGEIDMGLKPVIEYSEQLAEGEFKNYSVGLLHGKMKAKEKEETMRKFKNQEIDLLVSTTVVEVGVDVPNATIMLIENAERFGLSQLHQLRGRVGRGSEKSYCIVVSDARGESSKKRLSALKETTDGFKLAEYDLQMRGPGDFFGFRQHGLPTLRVADLAENVDTLNQAQQYATQLLSGDPLLESSENMLLKTRVLKMISAVGDRPN